MAGKKSIRITKNDRADFARLAKNSKAKINRVSKKYGVDLKSEISIPDSIESFQSRKAFNEWKKQQQSFTNRANTQYQFKQNKYGVVATVKEINKVKMDTRKAQSIAKEKIRKAKKLPFISGGKVQGKMKERIEMMSGEQVAGISVPLDFNFEGVSTQQRMKDKIKYMSERTTPEFYDKKQEQSKENFITMMERGFNSDADDVVEKMRRVPADVMSEFFIMIDEFDFNQYSSDNLGGINDSSKLDIIEGYLDMYFDGGIDLSLKKF